MFANTTIMLEIYQVFNASAIKMGKLQDLVNDLLDQLMYTVFQFDRWQLQIEILNEKKIKQTFS